MLTLTPAWCRNETIVTAHGRKCCHFPRSGILFSGLVPLARSSIIVRNVKKYGIVFFLELNVCMNEPGRRL